jgi:small subunit ribosomal protein S9
MAIKMRKKAKQTIKKVIKKEVTSKKGSVSAAKDLRKDFTFPKTSYIEGIGRRKVATSRVRIYEGKGDFVVNNMLVGEYFHGIENAHGLYNKPFDLTGTKGKFAVSVVVKGSGIHAQLEAMIHGLSRALVEYSPEFKTFLKEGNFLTRDDRMKETRKIGMGGKARRKRQSPKR